MTSFSILALESLTAQQLKQIEDAERRVSNQVWDKCMDEGAKAFKDGEKHYAPDYFNRDMGAAWRLGWFHAHREKHLWDKFDQETAQDAKPKPRAKRRKGKQ